MSAATLAPLLAWVPRRAPSLGPRERPRTSAATALAPAPRGAELAVLEVQEEGTAEEEEEDEKEEEEAKEEAEAEEETPGVLSALVWLLELFFEPSPFMAPSPPCAPLPGSWLALLVV